MNLISRALMFLIAVMAALPGGLGAQALPTVFDSPWIGYDTAVYPEGLGPWASTTGDFDRDGVADLATVSWGGTAALSILLADGAGGYEAAATQDLPFESLGLVAEDFDNDGDLDLVIADTGRFWEGPTVSIYRNDGAGSFLFGGSFDAGRTGPSGITAADFDGDGFLDVAVAHDAYIAFGTTIAILLNDQAGGFGAPDVRMLDSGTRAIAAGDLDGDLDPDLVVGHETNKFTILLNHEGVLLEEDVLPGIFAGSIPELPQVHLADIDLDGDRDLFFSNVDTGGFGAGSVGLWRNQGDATFAPPEEISFEIYTSGGVGMETADVTADGWPDLLLVTGGVSDWFLVEGDGFGGFLTPRRLRAGESPMSVQSTDLDLDGDLDVVVVAADSSEACVYLNPGNGAFVQPALIDMTSPQIAPAFPTLLQTGDVDADGDLDFVVGYRSDFENSFGIAVRRNVGDGTFAPIEIYPDTTYPVVVRLADLDGDLDEDLIWFDANSRFKRRLNRGDGSFGAVDSLLTVFGASYFDLYPVDADGDLDVVVATGFDVGVLMNHGDGTLAAPIYTPFDFFDVVGMGDFNHDDVLDLLTNSAVQGYPEISNGNGDGTFGQANSVPTGRDVHAFATGDLDADGNLDFAAVYNLDETGLSIRRGRGNGDFHLNENFHGSYDKSDHTSSLVLADADRDGRLDAMTANFGAQDLSLWGGLGDGSFAPLVRYGVAQPAHDVRFGDFDGDGIGDAAVITQAIHERYWYPAVVLLRGLDVGRELTLSQSPLRPGEAATWTIERAAPGEIVRLVLTTSGRGNAICPPALGGLCLDLEGPLKIIGSAEADADGTASITVTVPESVPDGVTVHTQAFVVRGSGGSLSVKSNAHGAIVTP